MQKFTLPLLLLVVSLTCAHAAVPVSSHVFIVVEENHKYSDVMKLQEVKEQLRQERPRKPS